MNRSKTKCAVAAAALATFAMMAVAPSVRAGDMYKDYVAQETYRSYAEGCARWESEGAGERIKCFDCLKQRGGVWVNTCKLTPRAAAWWGSFGVGCYGCSGPAGSGAIIPGHGIYCETSEKWCVIKERPGLPGTGCFCKVKGGYARGVVE